MATITINNKNVRSPTIRIGTLPSGIYLCGDSKIQYIIEWNATYGVGTLITTSDNYNGPNVANSNTLITNPRLVKISAISVELV